MSRRTAFQNGPFSAPVPDHAVPFGRRQLSMVLVFAEQSEKRVECFPNQLQEICLYFTMHVACFTFERYTKHLHRSHRAPGGPSDWQTVRDMGMTTFPVRPAQVVLLRLRLGVPEKVQCLVCCPGSRISAQHHACSFTLITGLLV